MFMMLFNWGPPHIREILWLSYPPVRYLDTIDAWEPHQWNEFEYLRMSLFFTIFYSLTIIILLVSVLLVRSKVRVWMWVWFEYGWEYGVSMDGCHSSLSAAQPQSLPLASFLSCIFFLRYKGVLLHQKYYVQDIQFVCPTVYPWEHNKNDECCPGYSLTVNH